MSGVDQLIKSIPDPQNIDQAIHQRNHWIEFAAQESANKDYYHGLLKQIGLTIGLEAFTSDDGSMQSSVICAKVPELVSKLRKGSSVDTLPPAPSAFGFCPICMAPGSSRERRPNGNDRCVQGHVYESAKAVTKLVFN